VSSAALASLLPATGCTARTKSFSPDVLATGLLATDKLARTRGGGTAEAACVLPPATLQAVADQAPLSLMQLTAEVLLLVLSRLDAQSLACFAAACSTCSAHFCESMTPVEEALRQRVVVRGHACPARFPQNFSSWQTHFAWLEHQRNEAYAPMAAAIGSSFFVAEGGQLMSCGMDQEFFFPGCSAMASLMVRTRLSQYPGCQCPWRAYA
jgi:hypothetical protein